MARVLQFQLGRESHEHVGDYDSQIHSHDCPQVLITISRSSSGQVRSSNVRRPVGVVTVVSVASGWNEPVASGTVCVMHAVLGDTALRF